MEDKTQKEPKEKAEKQNLKEELERCLKEKEEYLNGWKRAKADLINYKNEEGERIKDFIDYTKVDLILKILPILDNLERAEKHISEKEKDNKVIHGFIQIKKQIEDFLKKEEVKEIEVLGKKFNPETTEAIEEIDLPGKEPGTVAEVVRKGYKFKEKVIRPARAKIIKYKQN